MTTIPLSEEITATEKTLQQHKHVLESFPDALIDRYGTYSSKMVNKNFTGMTVSDNYGLRVYPYHLLTLDSIQIKVFSKPRYCQLVWAYPWRKDPVTKKPTMSFARVAANLSRNGFGSDMLLNCSVEIAKYLQSHPEYTVDTTHLPKKLKHILSFL